MSPIGNYGKVNGKDKIYGYRHFIVSFLLRWFYVDLLLNFKTAIFVQIVAIAKLYFSISVLHKKCLEKAYSHG